MKIISHRGFWLEPSQKNTSEAFLHSFAEGYGTETDIRDCHGQLVISHDPPSGGELLFKEFYQLTNEKKYLLALNVKADGLANSISREMNGVDKKDWFVFDMSIPDMRGHFRVGNPVFARVSEYEDPAPFVNQIAGLWMDAFNSDPWRIAKIQQYISSGLRCCLVSPELHGRAHLPFWESLKALNCENDDMILCTDFPKHAAEYFGIAR